MWTYQIGSELQIVEILIVDISKYTSKSPNKHVHDVQKLDVWHNSLPIFLGVCRSQQKTWTPPVCVEFCPCPEVVVASFECLIPGKEGRGTDVMQFNEELQVTGVQAIRHSQVKSWGSQVASSKQKRGDESGTVFFSVPWISVVVSCSFPCGEVNIPWWLHLACPLSVRCLPVWLKCVRVDRSKELEAFSVHRELLVFNPFQNIHKINS